MSASTRPAQPPSGSVPEEAFIIGPGRSGTTLLYKLLCLHPDVAYLTNLEHRLWWLPISVTGRLRLRSYDAKLKHWFAAQGNAYFVHRPLVRRAIPVPVEGEGVYQRCGVPLFPGRDFRPDPATTTALREAFAALRGATGARLTLSKRTANNRRLPLLNDIFPRAGYVNLIRDGREVAASLARVDWWNGHPLWWDRQRRTPAQAVAEGEDVLRLCARNWVAETEEIARGLAPVAPSRVLNVRFEELVSSPVEQMNRIVAFLGLRPRPGYDEALSSLRFGYRPQSWRQDWDAQQIDMVTREQGEHLTRLGYAS